MVIAAFIWAVAEATCFFILPDFFLFPAAVICPARWKHLVIAAILGSILGSLALYCAAQSAPDMVQTMLRSVSLVSAGKIERAGQLVTELGPTAFLIQPFTLIPLKVFTYLAASRHVALLYVVASLTAGRALRNCLVAYAGAWVGRKLPGPWRNKWKLLIPLYALIALALIVASMVV